MANFTKEMNGSVNKIVAEFSELYCREDVAQKIYYIREARRQNLSSLRFEEEDLLSMCKTICKKKYDAQKGCDEQSKRDEQIERDAKALYGKLLDGDASVSQNALAQMPTNVGLAQSLLDALYQIYQMFPVNGNFIERAIANATGGLTTDESLRFCILKQMYGKNGDVYATGIITKLFAKHLKTLPQDTQVDYKNSSVEEKRFFQLEALGEGVFDAYDTYKKENAEQKKRNTKQEKMSADASEKEKNKKDDKFPDNLKIFRMAEDLSNGVFRANGPAREGLYHFAFAFGMQYYPDKTIATYHAALDLEKVLFQDYYNDNFLASVMKKEWQAASSDEESVTGEGINFKNYAECIYLYCLIKGKTLKEANELIQGCKVKVRQKLEEPEKKAQVQTVEAQVEEKKLQVQKAEEQVKKKKAEVKKKEEKLKPVKTKCNQKEEKLKKTKEKLKKTNTALRQESKELKREEDVKRNAERQLQKAQVQGEETQLQKMTEQLREKEAALQAKQMQVLQTQAQVQQMKAQVEKAQTQVEAAQAQVKQVQAELEQAKVALRRAQAQVRAAKAELQQAKEDLQQTKAELQQAKLSDGYTKEFRENQFEALLACESDDKVIEHICHNYYISESVAAVMSSVQQNTAAKLYREMQAEMSALLQEEEEEQEGKDDTQKSVDMALIKQNAFLLEIEACFSLFLHDCIADERNIGRDIKYALYPDIDIDYCIEKVTSSEKRAVLQWIKIVRQDAVFIALIEEMNNRIKGFADSDASKVTRTNLLLLGCNYYATVFERSLDEEEQFIVHQESDESKELNSRDVISLNEVYMGFCHGLNGWQGINYYLEESRYQPFSSKNALDVFLIVFLFLNLIV